MRSEERCIITFFTVHQALRAEKVLLKEGFTISMIPVPREISSDCGVALRFSCEEKAKAEEILKNNKIVIEHIHHLGRERK